MKKLLYMFLAVSLLLFPFLISCTSAPPTVASRPQTTETQSADSQPVTVVKPAEKLEEISFKPLEFNPPIPVKHTLSNGMTVYLLEDNELPLFHVYALVKTGSIYEPEEKIGLSSIFATVMRTGGTTSRAPEVLNETLESLAASVEIGMSAEYATAFLSCLSDDTEVGLEIFADILMHPAFREDKLALRKLQVIEGIRRRNDNPVGIAQRYFAVEAYGLHHPMGWYPTEETVQNIRQADLKAFYERYFKPNNIMLAVTGDFKSARLLEQLENLFAAWKPGKVEMPATPQVEENKNGVVGYVFKDLSQSTILIGHLGLKRAPDNQDYFPLTVMNEILGASSFTSRLFREVRDKRGLAYSTGTVMNSSLYENPGVWFAYSLTRNDKTGEAVSVILDEINKIRMEPVGEDELNLIKEHIINSFIFGFESGSQVVFQQMMLDYRGYPQDYLANYTRKMAGVSSSDVLKAAQKYLHPDKLIIMVVGKAETFDKALSNFGRVKEIIPD
ncbi:MAG: pitrilysin family protein [Spirochaetota bacterium]